MRPNGAEALEGFDLPNYSQEKKEKSRAALKRAGMIVGTAALCFVLSVLIFACIFAVYIKKDLSDQLTLSGQDFSLNQTSIIYCQDRKTGEWSELQRIHSRENRIWASYNDLPQDLINACVAIEDKRFYDHRGVDWVTTGRASLRIFMGRGGAGGSTITQQLIKNLTGDQEITVRRKITEMFRALEFEKTHSKEDVLEWYMNVIYLGEGCYGVRTAAQAYFGKDVSDLTLAECASLIGITNNPSMYDPYINPENNRERQLIILGEMLDQKMITREQYQEAVAQEMDFHAGKAEESQSGQYYSYFVDQVIRDVTDALCEQYGYSEAIAEKMLLCSGYQIYCTMDPAVQSTMEDVYENLDNVPKTRSSQQLQSAMVVVDNASGDVVGIVGGVGKKPGSLVLSRATQSTLSPGSSIKPLSVYGPALEKGIITPASVYEDSPYSFVNGRGYPKNTGNSYRGFVTVNYAVEQSLNTIAVKVASELTPEYCFDFAKNKMGLSTLTDSVEIDGKVFTDSALAPMAMGGLTRGVTVRDMTTAYAALANGGVYRKARTFVRVDDVNGKTILENEQKTHTAMQSKAAWYMTYMLHNATISGTSTQARLNNIQVAAKTGTTTSDRDRWFAAYTPYYTGVVWCGYDVPEEVILTQNATNPSLAMWKKVMTGIHEGLPARNFTEPEGLMSYTFCADSGMRMSEACQIDPRGSRGMTLRLFKEDVPTGVCDVHVPVDICAESGKRATEYCRMHEAPLKVVGMLSINRAFPQSGVHVGDEAYALPIEEENLAQGYHPALPWEESPLREECDIHSQPPAPEPAPEGTAVEEVRDPLTDPNAEQQPAAESTQQPAAEPAQPVQGEAAGQQGQTPA